MLTAFFDMRKLPVNSDFFYFMTSATMAAQAAGCESFRVIVVPGAFGGFRDDQKYAASDLHWRYRSLILGATKVFPACAGLLTARSLDEARALEKLAAGGPGYPGGYAVDHPEAAYLAGLFLPIAEAAKAGKTIPATRASDGARAFVRERLAKLAEGREVLTISLRECPYKTVVNSDPEAWADVVRQIGPERFKIVLVRDTHQVWGAPFGNALDDLPQFPEAALDVDVRMALYEQAYLNLWTANGASFGIGAFNPAIRFLQFKNIGAHQAHRPEYFREWFLLDPDRGEQPPWFTREQRMTWRDEVPAEMMAEFASMVAHLEGAAERRAA